MYKKQHNSKHFILFIHHIYVIFYISPKAITTILTITIEFLLSTEQSEYLFNEIF